MTKQTERCYLGEIQYYLQCSSCTQVDYTKLCYSTKEEVKEHLKNFMDRFKLDEPIGRLDNIGD